MSTVVGALRFDLGLNTAAFDSGMDRADGKAKSFAGGIVRAFAPIAGAIAAAFSVRAVSQMADAWSDMNSRLRNATGSTEAGAAAMDRLQQVARRSYSSITQTTEAFLSQTTTLNGLGVSTEKQLDLTEMLNNALVISATRGDKARSVMDAWSKAMALGELRGDNLNNIIANSDRLAQALADSMGINVNELRKYGQEGKITRDMMLGVTDQLEKLREEAGEMPATLSDGMTIMGDSVLQLVGRFDQALGISETFAGFMVSIGDAISAMTPYIIAAATAISGALAPAFDMLVSGLSVFGDLVPIVGAALAAQFGVAAIGMITNLSIAIGTTLVGAIKAVGVAMMANPIGLIVAAIAAAITAVYLFRDEIKQVIGVDVIEVIRTAANRIIGAFVGAYEAVKEAWGRLPSFFSAIGKEAWNALLEGFSGPAISWTNPFTGQVHELLNLDLTGAQIKLTGDETAALKAAATTFNKAFAETDYIDKFASSLGDAWKTVDEGTESINALSDAVIGGGAGNGGGGSGGGGGGRGGLADNLKGALESMREALMTEEQLELDSYEKRLAQIQEFYDRGLIMKEEYDQMMEQVHQLHADRMNEITKRQVEEEARIRSQLVGHASSVFGSLSSIMRSFGDENLAASKAFAVAAAIINTAEGITKALAQGGMLGFAGAAAVAAAGAAQISTIMSAQKGGGRRPSVGRGGSSVQAAAQPQAAPEVPRQTAVSISIPGGDFFSREQMERFVTEMLDMQRDGNHIVLERI